TMMRPQGAKRLALRQAMLGSVYLELGRYEDATQCFEGALRDWPGHGPFHAGLAESYLLRDDPESEVLKWATLAVEEDRADKGVAPESYNENLSEDLAMLAWATATASKDRAQVDRLVDEAATLSSTLLAATRAQTQFHAGMAYAALGDDSRA